MSPPEPALPNSTSHMTLDKDAYIVEVGRVPLDQKENGTTRPICYLPRSLTDVKRNVTQNNEND